jgi:hypothetical protein
MGAKYLMQRSPEFLSYGKKLGGNRHKPKLRMGVGPIGM